MDPQIEELKQLVRQNLAVSEETRLKVEQMQNAARVATALRIVLWVAVIGLSLYSLMSIAPYFGELMNAYSGAQDMLGGF